jgi:hypothetical protein
MNIYEYPIGATPLEHARYQVAVMEAAETGAIVEFTRNWEDHEWEEIKTPSWDWSDSSYRIKPVAIAKGSNPKNLTEDTVGVKDGWRLLTKEECKVRMFARENNKDIQMLTNNEWATGNGRGYYGNCVDESYRTKKPEGYFLQGSKPAIGHNPDKLTEEPAKCKSDMIDPVIRKICDKLESLDFELMYDKHSVRISFTNKETSNTTNVFVEANTDSIGVYIAGIVYNSFNEKSFNLLLKVFNDSVYKKKENIKSIEDVRNKRVMETSIKNILNSAL